MIKRLAFIILALALGWQVGQCCTSALVPACKSATGRPLMWKHRDTGTEGNFIERVPASGDCHGYVALFNEGDSLLQEAWMGYNDAGFAIMNTASYNVSPYAGPKDKEGEVMTLALRHCTTVDDFCHLLDSLPSPAGIMANFGVMDSAGGLAYIEADDQRHIRYNVTDTLMVRTNYSVGWPKEGGRGFERYCDLYHCIKGIDLLSPLDFVADASACFYDSSTGIDYLAADSATAPDNGRIIPRGISTASIVIEGAAHPDSIAMWTVLGFPPLGSLYHVSLNYIPDELRPTLPGAASAESREVNAQKRAYMSGKNFNLREMRRHIERSKDIKGFVYNFYQELKKCHQQ